MWKLANEINWTEGFPGRGILLRDGELHTWNGSEGEGLTHPQYAHHNGIEANDIHSLFYIDPDGGVRAWLGDHLRPEGRQMIQEADPRLNAEASGGWHFGAQWYKTLKGLTLHDGTEHQFGTDTTHITYMLQNGIEPEQIADYWATFDNGEDPPERESLMQPYGDWYEKAYHEEKPKEYWRFGADEGDVLDWDEGNEGKGIIDRSGHVYTWDENDYEVHHDYLTEHPDIVPMRYFYIEPDGQCRGQALGDELDDMDEEVLKAADPRLYVQPEEANTWAFARANL